MCALSTSVLTIEPGVGLSDQKFCPELKKNILKESYQNGNISVKSFSSVESTFSNTTFNPEILTQLYCNLEPNCVTEVLPFSLCYVENKDNTTSHRVQVPHRVKFTSVQEPMCCIPA